MNVGQRYRRLDDGVEGLAVRCGDGAVRILYNDRGEALIAPKSQHWVPIEDAHRLPLRDEEIAEVAGAADQMLESLEKHEPLRWWTPRVREKAHDPELVRVVSEYLRGRGSR